MGKCIIRLEGKFMQWDFVTNAPITPLLPEPLFQNYWYAEYGRSGWVDYANPIEDAKKHGCSDSNYTVDEIILNNHAGEKGKKLTKSQIIEAYTCDIPEEFQEWSQRRDMDFQKMAVGLSRENAENKKRKLTNFSHVVY